MVERGEPLLSRFPRFAKAGGLKYWSKDRTEPEKFLIIRYKIPESAYLIPKTPEMSPLPKTSLLDESNFC